MEKLNLKNFEQEVLKGSGLIVVDFYADWCGPCRMLAPVLNSVSEEEKDVTFFKVNVDENNELAFNYKVTSIPTLIFFKDGQVLEKVLGFLSKELLKEYIDKYK